MKYFLAFLFAVSTFAANPQIGSTELATLSNLNTVSNSVVANAATLATKLSTRHTGATNLWSYGGIADDGLSDDLAFAAFSSSTAKELVLTAGTWNINTNLNVIGGKQIRFERGAVISIASGVTITFAGTILAGNYQIFSGSGTIFYHEDCPMGYVNVVWFGAIDSLTRSNDSLAAFNKALACVTPIANRGSYVYVPGGNYWFSAGMTVPTSLDMRGDGYEYSVLRSSFATSGTLLAVGGNREVRLRDLTLLNDPPSVSTNTALSVGTSGSQLAKLELNGVKFAQWTANALAVTNIGYLRAFNCFFTDNKNSATFNGTTSTVARAFFLTPGATPGSGDLYANAVYFDQCRFTGNDQSFLFPSGTGFGLSSCTFESEGNRLGTNAPSTLDLGETAISSVSIRGCYFEGNYSGGAEAIVKLQNVYGASISGTVFANNLADVQRSYNSILIVTNGYGVNISGNRFNGTLSKFIANGGTDFVFAPANSYEESNTLNTYTNRAQVTNYLSGKLIFTTAEDGLQTLP